MEITAGESLGAESLSHSFVTPIPKPRAPKKRSRTPRGYIVKKKINGRDFYYYCWHERNAAGEYPQKSEYLGTAETIRDWKYQVKGGK